MIKQGAYGLFFLIYLKFLYFFYTLNYSTSAEHAWG